MTRVDTYYQLEKGGYSVKSARGLGGK